MNTLRGTGALMRLALRRDRVFLPIVLLIIWVMTYYSAVAVKDLYTTPEALILANEEANASTGVVAMYGHIVDTSSVGGVAANKLAMIDFLILAFLVIAVVRRHTRAEEESGRFELLGSTPVGRLAPLAAAVSLGVLVSLASGLVSAPLAIAGGWPSTGSFALGLAMVGVGVSFTVITAVAMQVSANTRTCSAWAYGALGAAFVLRMVGDVSWGHPWAALSWLSPLGWGQLVRPFDGDRFWVLLVPVVFAVAGLWVAVALQQRRDLGAGLMSDRPGPAEGAIETPFALAWRLTRGSVFGWFVTYLVLGVLMGSIIGSVGGLMSGGAEDLLRRMGGVGTMDQIYLTMVMALAGMGAAAFGVSCVMHLRADETTGQLEYVLSTPVRRATLPATYLIIALVGSVVLMAVLGAAAAGLHARSASSMGFWHEATAGLVMLPAVWVMTAVALLVVGWLPKWDWLGWATLAFVILVGEMGDLIGLPGWVRDISPFAHLPKLPVEAMDWTPVLIETALAIVFILVAVLGFRRRDIPVA